MMTRSAPVSVMPTPPTPVVRNSTGRSGLLLNLLMISSRSLILEMAPVSQSDLPHKPHHPPHHTRPCRGSASSRRAKFKVAVSTEWA